MKEVHEVGSILSCSRDCSSLEGHTTELQQSQKHITMCFQSKTGVKLLTSPVSGEPDSGTRIEKTVLAQ